MCVKYMGSSDIHRLEKGETFGGQLSKEDALDRDIEWNWENNHIVDTSEYDDVPDKIWELILDPNITSKEFRDVTNLERVPTNAAQQMWRGAAKSEVDASVKASGTAETDTEEEAGGGPSEATDVGARGTSTGGSTAGDVMAQATGRARKSTT